MFNKIPLPMGKKQLIMGEGYHITPGHDHGRPGTPRGSTSCSEPGSTKWLKGIDNGIDKYGPRRSTRWATSGSPRRASLGRA